MSQRNFEAIFREFVTYAGGEVIPESREQGEQRADFLFGHHQVVAELKTLDKDARNDHAEKLTALLSNWTRTRRLLVYGRTSLQLRRLAPDLQQEWMSLLERPVERIIKKAQSQLVATKRTLELEGFENLLIIANEGNLLYTTAEDYLAVVSRVLKKTRDGALNYPEIQSVLYIGSGQWLYGSLNKRKPDRAGLLQVELRNKWPTFFADRSTS